MSQTIVYPQNKFESLGAINPAAPAQHIELADQTISTTGTMFAAQDFGVATLRQLRVRVRVKGVNAADAKSVIVRVSTTSAMTSPEILGIVPVPATVLTTDIFDVDVVGFSVTGFQYLQASFTGTTTITYDAVLEATP